MPTLKGSRPRPRVALIGEFNEDIVKAFGMLFPTLWMAENLFSLGENVTPKETDLIIIASGYSFSTYDYNNFDFINNSHIICFSNSISSLPGPSEGSDIKLKAPSSTEENVIPSLSLEKHNLGFVQK